MKRNIYIFLITFCFSESVAQCNLEVNDRNDNMTCIANAYESIYVGANGLYQIAASLSYAEMSGKTLNTLLFKAVYYNRVEDSYIFAPRLLTIYFNDGTNIQIKAVTYDKVINNDFITEKTSFNLDNITFMLFKKSIIQMYVYDNRTSKGLRFKLKYADALFEQLMCIINNK